MSKRTTFLALALAAIMSLGLFMISYQVQDLEDQLDSLNRDIARDSRAVHVLQAEWAHLNDPQRLRMLSERYLGLEPIATRQLGKVEDIPWRPLVAASERKIEPAPQEAAPAAAQPASSGDKPLEDALPAIRRALGLAPAAVTEVRR
ncbi:MAG: hypothetical protein COW30_18020 [Rhodospirillales bacterium CG15_BIG_FIL_POST_REV_8_21_14_020_66_15]|nr:MAG: hypothetical protein COW30_18020 [Rhodospirillales bacterium CG15_BIG_FIL_POST_REV_8_21_14_020_66_15]